MKKTLLIIGAIVMMAGFSTRVMAQVQTTRNKLPTSTGTSTFDVMNQASAQLIVPMTLTKVLPLNFGALNVGTAPDFVVLNTNETRTIGGATGGVTLSSFTGKQQPSCATYTVSGTYDQTYALTMDATITLNGLSSGGAATTMTVTDLTVHYTNGLANNEAPANGSSSRLDGSGSDSFKIGGKLTLIANQPGGVYSGNFLAAVDYN